MAGLTDLKATAYLNDITGCIPLVGTARWLGLFTTAPTSDSGVVGATEVSAASYARLQVAGQVAATGSFTTASTTIAVGSGNSWIVAGMNVYDTTNSQQIGTVSTYSGTTLTLTGTATHASSGSTDNLQISLWPTAANSSGSEPSVTAAAATSGAAATFAASGATAWGTAVAWGIFDAATSGNNLFWDWIGNNKWFPFTGSNASPCVLTNFDVSPTTGANLVVTAKEGSALPATGGSWAGALTATNISGSTFSAGVNSTGTGDGLFRLITEQVIPINSTYSVPAGSFIVSMY